MEIELVTEDEALDRPAGRARDDPNQNPTLDPPKSAFCYATIVDSNFDYILIILQFYKLDHICCAGALICNQSRDFFKFLQKSLRLYIALYVKVRIVLVSYVLFVCWMQSTRDVILVVHIAVENV